MKTSALSPTTIVACKLMLFPTTLALLLLIIQLAPLKVSSSDADPLQDFCVADLAKDLYLNGYPCKKPASVTTDDFVFQGFAAPPQTNTSNGASAINGFVASFPGLNSHGISIIRLDFAKGGLILPHTHPRGNEIVYVLQGSLYAGFVTTANKLFSKVIHKGDVMAFPRGLIHFQLNVGDGPAQALAVLNSQNPGFQLIPYAMFGSNITDEVLQKSFLLDQKTIDPLKATFSQGFINSAGSLLSSTCDSMTSTH